MATGEEEPSVAFFQNVPARQNQDAAEEIDPFQEGEADCTGTDDV